IARTRKERRRTGYQELRFDLAMDACNRYDTLEWLACVRGQLDSTVTSAMKEHCESCSECQGKFDFFSKVAQVAELNSQGPPESWTSEAAAMFEAEQPSGESKVYGDLVFDSYLHDTEAVRSRRLEMRHLVFDFPAFEIDLALECSGS